jgi:hypothetical protein
MVSQINCTSKNKAQLSRNCKLQKVITFSSELRMRHEYSHWKDNSEENVSKQSELDFNASILLINSVEE